MGSMRDPRSEEHTSELQSRLHLVCRLLLEKNYSSNARVGGWVGLLVYSFRRLKARTAPSTPRRRGPSASHYILPRISKPNTLFFSMIRRPTNSPLFPYTTFSP